MISAVLSIVIVNIAYSLYAKLMGANVMFFNRVTKLGAYVVLWAVLFSTFGMQHALRRRDFAAVF